MSGHDELVDGVSITEAARLLGTSRPTLSKLLSEHEFPRHRAKGKTLVSIGKVREFYAAYKAGKTYCVTNGSSEIAEEQALSLDLAEQVAQLTQQVAEQQQQIAQLQTALLTAREPAPAAASKPSPVAASRGSAEPSPTSQKPAKQGVLRRMLAPWG